MKNNLADNKPTLDDLIAANMMDGTAIGLDLFLRHNRVKLDKTPKGGGEKDTLAFIVNTITAEVFKDVPYPFEDSFMQRTVSFLQQENDVLEKLYEDGDIEAVKLLLKTMGSACVAQFLEDNRQQVLKLILDFRSRP